MIRVLVVDDSSFMRISVTHILTSDRIIEVVGTADNGADAIKRVKELSPDVVLLDIEMPVMDGLTALAHIMSECPTPVVMLSGLTEKDASVAIKSLEHGAVDFIPKPSGVISYDIEKISNEIISKVKIAAEVDVRKITLELPRESFRKEIKHAAKKEIVVIGASTGGPRAVAAVLSGITRGIHAGIIVVQHLSQEFIPAFTERLKWGSSLDFGVAGDNEIIKPGRVLIAPGRGNTKVERDIEGRSITMIMDSDDSALRTPKYAVVQSIDYTMESAANVYGESALAVLLTGIGSDGAMGMKAIKEAGGNTIAEDKSTCIVYGMPKAAIEIGAVDEVVPLPEIADAIMRMV